ncbi:MAG: RNA ligase [Candidatus ainarchaeum sp.]|nr:RNA ligase [Candidatus ainarchaeum sp.]
MEIAVLKEGLKRGKADKPPGELQYIRFREGFRSVERGTVVIGNRVIWGFPHIKRIFTLEKGLKRNMTGDMFYAEEKIDGFNIRIASVNGKIYAFSRGGFLDMFVTEKAREMKLERFFRDNPGMVLCGEMIGNTPYTEPADGFDVKLFVFDIDEGDGDYFPVEQRYNLLKRYGIESVPKLGRFRSDDYSGLRRLALVLNRGKKEGMVLKSADRQSAVKYVTPWADVDDIAKASGMLFDMPIGFYYQRVLRSAMFINDFGMDRDGYARKLGRAFYDGLIDAIRRAGDGEEIYADFEIRIKDKAVWNDVRRHMSKDVKIEEISRKEFDGRTRIRFRKIYKRTTKTLMAYAAGKGITD